MRSSAFHFEERQPRDERAQLNTSTTREESYNESYPPMNGPPSRYSRRTYDYHYPGKSSSPHHGGGGASHGPHPASAHGGSPHHGRMGYPPQSHTQPHYPPYPPHTRPPRHLQSVITNSFSLEDERCDDMNRAGGRGMMNDPRYNVERRNDMPEREEPATSERDADMYYHASEFDASHSLPPTPRASAAAAGRPAYPIHRSFSAGSSQASNATEPLKRSYFHHSRPNEVQTGQLPPEFMPPKRVKVDQPARGEVVVTPRSPHHGMDNRRQTPQFGRAPTWETEEAAAFNRLPRAQSFPPQQSWINQPSPGGPRTGTGTTMELAHVSPAGESDASPVAWRQEPSPRWGPSPSSRPTGRGAPYRFWESPQNMREDGYEHGEPRAREECHEPSPRGHSKVGFEKSDPRKPPLSHSGARVHDDKMKLVVDAAAAAGETSMGKNYVRRGSDDPLLLLALPQDRVALSETLCVVRENIEVFTATQSDVDAPAPGRKHAVVVGQVGLRCIHCRHTTKCSDRVKRAVCYPSSIKRIYRTVIDMKLDHFSQCKFVPDALKSRLHQLKAVQTRSTGTTMQYFIRAAHALGMEDGPSGVRLVDEPKPVAGLNIPTAEEPKQESSKTPVGTVIIRRNDSISGESTNTSVKSASSSRSNSMMSTESFDSTGSPETTVSLDKYYDGNVPLALPEDKASLSPLRCFLREQVCAFSATEEDIAVRAPTTFSICVGQVGIGCIHCVKQPSKLRSNRAVCFPFSIGRIYQSVADIQRFHFTECKMLPADVKDKFLELQSASSKGSKGLATRQYWVTSAKKIGLVDTQRGIRFGRDPTKPESAKAFSLDILAQAAFSVTTANKQLVVPEDRASIAEFLYVVMEQLQPCRFTEADRNKRRLKDVGCIGVECKHCAGQVDSRKFFWSSVNAVESNFVSVHTHMLECRMVPESLKNHLMDLKKLRKEQTAALRTGSQKAFFARVWQRLHDEEQHHLQHGQNCDMMLQEPEYEADVAEIPSPVHSPSVSSQSQDVPMASV